MKSEAFKILYAHLCVFMRFYACFRVSPSEVTFFQNWYFRRYIVDFNMNSNYTQYPIIRNGLIRNASEI